MIGKIAIVYVQLRLLDYDFCAYYCESIRLGQLLAGRRTRGSSAGSSYQLLPLTATSDNVDNSLRHCFARDDVVTL